MAIVTVCDRCNLPVGEEAWTDIHPPVYVIHRNDEEIDICRRCFNELQSFMRARSEKGDIGAWIEAVNQALPKVGGTDA